MNITIIGKPKSKAVLDIIKETGIKKYSSKCDGVINYGMAGDRLTEFISKHPSSYTKPMINKFIGCSKYKSIKDAEDNNILVPETLLSLPKQYNVNEFLSKMRRSQGGKGIVKATTHNQLSGRYYQKFLSNRKYELRIHAFLWIDQKDWAVQKRLGSDEVIAWNFNNGGKFQTVHNPELYKIFSNAKDISSKILKIRNMAFGAIDLVVTKDEKTYFLEINSAPGFTDLSRNIYINALSKLKELTKKEFLVFCN